MVTQVCCLYFSEYSPKTKLWGPSVRQGLLFVCNERPAGAAAGPCMRGSATLCAGKKLLECISHLRLKSSSWLPPSRINALQSIVKSPCPPHSALAANFQRGGLCVFFFSTFPPGDLVLLLFPFHASGRAQLLQLGQSASNVQTSQTNFCS